MISYEKIDRSDGSIGIRIGRSITELRTSKEAVAFLAGVKMAHLLLRDQILPILDVKDGRYD